MATLRESLGLITGPSALPLKKRMRLEAGLGGPVRQSEGLKLGLSYSYKDKQETGYKRQHGERIDKIY